MAAVSARIDVIEDYSDDMRKMLPYFQLVDDLNDGIDAMRLGGERYLPKFPKEQETSYKFRLMQTKMTNVFADILESLAAKPFEEPIRLDGEERDQHEWLREFVKDVDGAGQDISTFSMDVMEAGIRSAVDWLFIDYPKRDESVRTQADKVAKNIRPFWSRIIAVNVREARVVMKGGDERLTYFRYMEPGKKPRIRTIWIDGDGVVKYELYEKGEKYDDKTKTAYKLIESGVIDIDEIPIVPFITGRRIGRTFVLKPPMKAAADLQRDLYEQESALKYAKIITAFPMLSGNGVKPEKNPDGTIKPIDVGPQVVLYAPTDNAGNVGEWKYVEPQANNMMFLSKDIDRDIQNLRELGRQPLTAQTSNLTTVTTAFAAGKSKSSVSAWAGKLQKALEHALRITLKWENITDAKFKVFVFTEFDEFTDGKDMESLNTSRANKDISRETYWSESKRRGFLSDSFDPAKEKERLAQELLEESPEPSGDPIRTGG